MTTTNTAPARASARDRLLAAADELFYAEGINTVGIDRVIERAGVAKASLYDCFGSKEELIRSYLQLRGERRQARMLARLALHDTARAKILSVFDSMIDAAAQPDFRGCAFVRASSEAKSGSSIRQVCDAARAWTRSLFVELAMEVGADDPQRLARELVLLYDGAAVSAHIDGNRASVDAARAMAAVVVDARVAA